MTDSLLESGSQHLAEVILAILLPSFHVSLSNERISWTMKAFSAPVVEGSSQPTMPLVLSLLRSDDDV